MYNDVSGCLTYPVTVALRSNATNIPCCQKVVEAGYLRVSWVNMELLARLSLAWRSFGGGLASSAESYTGECLFSLYLSHRRRY